MTSEELSTLPDATLIAIARNCPSYEQSESLRGLVMELAKRLEDTRKFFLHPLEISPSSDDYGYSANLLLRD